MRLDSQKLKGTTDASGDLVVTGNAILGRLYAVHWDIGTFAAGVDATLKYTDSEGVERTVLTLTDANASDEYYVREATHDNAGAASVAAGEEAMPMIDGKPKLTVAQGGNAKTGSMILYYFRAS